MNITISTDKSKLDIPLIHNYLHNDSYWAKKIPLEIVERSIENSLCFGVYNGADQIGFARIMSDCATFAYLADVFILPEYRGNGLSKQLMEYIMSYPSLQGLRRWMLATADAHELYRKYGFTDLSKPLRFMELARQNIYNNEIK
jgi:GNAT superfamily N-acetyltransferase